MSARHLQGIFKTYSCVLMKTSWRRLEDIFCLRLQRPSSRRLDQNKYIRLSHTSSRHIQDVLSRRLQVVFKTPSRRLAKTSSRHLQDVFNMFQDVLQKLLQEIFKTSPRRFEDVFKTSPRYLQGVLQGCFEDFFKTYYQVKMFLLTSLQDVFNTFLRRSAKRIIYRRICLGHTSEKFLGSVQNLQDR